MSTDEFREQRDEWNLERAADHHDRAHDMDALLGQERRDPGDFAELMAEPARARHRVIGAPT